MKAKTVLQIDIFHRQLKSFKGFQNGVRHIRSKCSKTSITVSNMEVMSCGETQGGTINKSYEQAVFPYRLPVLRKERSKTGMPLARVAVKIDRNEEQHVSIKFFCGKK